MKRNSSAYEKFAIVREMYETPEVLGSMSEDSVARYLPLISGKEVLLTGEGSSRIFPGKKAVRDARAEGYPFNVFTETATQAREYPLEHTAVAVASNSGKTAECVRLIRSLRSRGHRSILGVTTFAGSPVDSESDDCYILTCGEEQAVAATKSVMEQALFYDLLLRKGAGAKLPDIARIASGVGEALDADIPGEIVDRMKSAGTIYWAGRNDGAAEELTLKTNEITRKPSDFLQGTYAVHGIEEVMEPRDILIWVDPYPEEAEKFNQVLVRGVGLSVVAMVRSGEEGAFSGLFPVLPVPECGTSSPYAFMAAGWNLLVETGIALGIELDKPVRARKVGNEFTG